MSFVVEKVREALLADGKYNNKDEQRQQKSRESPGGDRRTALVAQPLINGLAGFAVNTIWAKVFYGHSFYSSSRRIQQHL